MDDDDAPRHIPIRLFTMPPGGGVAGGPPMRDDSMRGSLLTRRFWAATAAGLEERTEKGKGKVRTRRVEL